MGDDLSLLRDEVVELRRLYDRSEQESEDRIQGLQQELLVERQKRRELKAHFVDLKKLCEESAATADGLKTWARMMDHQRDDFHKKCSELERLVARLALERDRLDGRIQALFAKVRLESSPFEEMKD